MHVCVFFLIFVSYVVFFFNDTATTEIYTLSLHDALPIYLGDYAVIADRRKEPTISHEQFVSELKQDGILPS